MPLLARLDEGWLKSVQLTWDAFNHDWRRHVVGFNYDRQRSLWRDWKMDRLPPAVITAIVAGMIGLWGAAMLGLISWWRRRTSDQGAFCGTRFAAASRMPGCRGSCTKDRSRSARGLRRAGPSSRSRFA